MKEKIIARLKALFSGVNLSNARIDAIADKLSSKITDEKDIDAKLTELNEITPFSELAKLDDYNRGKEAKDKADKEKADKEKAEKERKEKEEKDKTSAPPAAEVPEWAKALIETNKKLEEKIGQIESGNAAKTHQEKLMSLFKEKNIPEKFFTPMISGREFKDMDAADAFGQSVVTSYEDFAKEAGAGGLSSFPKPGNPGGKTDGKEKATKEEVKSVIDNIM